MRPADIASHQLEQQERKAGTIREKYQRHADERQRLRAEAWARECDARDISKRIEQAERERRSADKNGFLPGGEHAPTQTYINELRNEVLKLGFKPPMSDADRAAEAWLSSRSGSGRTNVSSAQDEPWLKARIAEVAGRPSRRRVRRSNAHLPSRSATRCSPAVDNVVRMVGVPVQVR
jgi:hypothetical protein